MNYKDIFVVESPIDPSFRIARIWDFVQPQIVNYTSKKFNIKPIYKTFPGWKTKTEGIRNLKDLPGNAKKYVHALEDFIGARISSISTSPEREDTILVEDPFNN